MFLRDVQKMFVREEMAREMLFLEAPGAAMTHHDIPRRFLKPNPYVWGDTDFPVITNHPLSINQSHLLTGLLVKASCFN